MDETLLIVIVSIGGGLAMVCAIVAGAVTITRITTHHRERMARIGMGLDPDAADRSVGTGSERPSNAPTAGWDPLAGMRSQAPHQK